MKMNDGLKVILFQEITDQHRNKLNVLVTEKEGLNLVNSESGTKEPCRKDTV